MSSWVNFFFFFLPDYLFLFVNQVPPGVGLRQVRRGGAHPGLPHRQHVGPGVAEHLLAGLALPGRARPGNVDLKECFFPGKFDVA